MNPRLIMFICCMFVTLSTGISYSLEAQDSEFISERILYTAFDDFTYYINSINLDGTDQRILAQSNSGWFRPSPDGENIVSLQHRSGSLMEGEYDIYLMNLDNSGLMQLTNAGYNSQPVWSPLGDKIAYLAGQDNSLDIYLLDLADLSIDRNEIPNAIRLTDIGQYISSLEWSPDGQKLAFTICDEELLCDIFLVAPDGTGLESVTHEFDDTVSSISWSPDSQGITFVAYPSGEYQNANIYSLDIQQHTISRLSHISADYMSLQWSPDGSSLAYSSNQADTWDIYLLDSRSLEVINLTVDSVLQDGFYGLSWSPDGHRIAFSAGPSEGDFEIFVMNSDGSNLYQLTNNDAHDTNPVWVRQTGTVDHSARAFAPTGSGAKRLVTAVV